MTKRRLPKHWEHVGNPEPTNPQFTREKHFFKAPEGAQLCTFCGHPKKTSWHYTAPEGFQPMETAPRNLTNIEIMSDSDQIFVGHWAEDSSGDHQPPFKGFFRSDNRYEIPNPKGWRPIKS